MSPADTGSSITSVAGERRHLTVLFCDLVGSTEIAAQLDPEEWRELVASYHRAAAEAITRYGGHVAKFLGDGVMAFFGYPEAHDNDAERAARAGLAIIEALAKLNEPPARLKLSARVGIDSGPVVVGAGAGNDTDVFGDTPNIAARVQALAEPGVVLITAATHRLVSGLFVVEERGAQVLRGFAKPVDLYRVVRPSGMRGRLAAAAAVRGMTPFTDREEELHLLMNRWERARDGKGQVVTIVGEAGIGKSRLVQHFREQIGADPHTWLECATAPFFQNTPFYAFTDMLQQTFHWHTNQNPERRLTALEASLALAELRLEEAVPLIGSLLEVPFGAKYPPLSMAPEQQRKRLLATLVAWTIGFAKAQPLVLATEDLHWADPSTLELIQLAVEQGATAPLMLLHTARPEFRIQWPMRAHHTQITLNRLSAHDVRTMVGQVAAQTVLPAETIAAVVERTSGVPLFVEELTRAVLESGDVRLSSREIPATLHDSLMARLDRLGPAKEIIQIGAVIGSEFSYELLQAVQPISEKLLQSTLLNLTNAELLYVRGIAPDATYLFKHALIRDVAYEALLKSRRIELHGIVARTIDGKFDAFKEAHPEILAHHWTEAGEIEPGVAEWSRAGKASEARNAFREAQQDYQQALALISQLPESSERDQRELEFRQSLVRVLFITTGYSAPETIEASERAATLAERSGNLRFVANLLISRGVAAVIGRDLSAALPLADRALELAVRDGSRSALARAEMLQIMTHYNIGDLASAEQHFMAGQELFNHPSFRRNPTVAIAVFNYASWTAWAQGRSNVARDRMTHMMAIANPNNPYEIAFSAHFAAQLEVWLREYEQAEKLAAQAVALADEHRFVETASVARCFLGLARAQLGHGTEGIQLVRQGISDLLQAGDKGLARGQMLSLAIAQICGDAVLDALETVERVLHGKVNLFWPEALCLRGELRLKQQRREEADADFREAVTVARNMSAKALELRATMSLARLLASEGRREEAHAMLADIYNWFTEGFDTTDLKEAKALLDELSG
jgi:class 3 adenylate cyclase/tetratricopeptide (TPR) repeat protein